VRSSRRFITGPPQLLLTQCNTHYLFLEEHYDLLESQKLNLVEPQQREISEPSTVLLEVLVEP